VLCEEEEKEEEEEEGKFRAKLTGR